MPEGGAARAQVGERQAIRQEKIANVDRIVAVASCKGGVGKSTVAVHLALALAKRGAKVGLADVDVYGPSAPIMLGVNERPKPVTDNVIPPVRAHGIEVMSMGFFLDDSAPVIWRGPMAMSATRQFLRGVSWSGLDYLVVDLPPGTGDIVLTLAQEVPLDGAVIVTTPQDVALADVKRGISMLRKVNANVLGIVSNMAGFVCGACGTRDDVFGSRSGEQLALELGLPLLGEIPIDETIRESGDSGVSVIERDESGASAQAFLALGDRVRGALDATRSSASGVEPVEISQDAERAIVRIEWSDGKTTEYAMSGLRGWCPCAECQGHSGQRTFVTVAAPRVAGVEAVGRYAIRFLWQDGHSTGMYSYDYLRELADFPECKV